MTGRKAVIVGGDGEQILGRQALKTKLTREKILNAVIALIKEGGFGAASSSKIAKHAGVTWGAVQHHFGSKEDILVAILELSHEQFTRSLDVVELRRGSLEQRVNLFIDKMWAHYQSDLYLAALEIILATRSSPHEAVQKISQKQGREHLRHLREIFPDSTLSDRDSLDALIFCHTVLTGTTLQRVLEPGAANIAKNIRRVKGMLLEILAGG